MESIWIHLSQIKLTPDKDSCQSTAWVSCLLLIPEEGISLPFPGFGTPFPQLPWAWKFQTYAQYKKYYYKLLNFIFCP